MRLRMIRLCDYSPLVAGARLITAPELMQSIAKIEMRLREISSECTGPLESRQSLEQTTEAAQQAAIIVVKRRVRDLRLYRLLEKARRFGGASRLRGDDTQQVQCAGIGTYTQNRPA